MVHWFIWVWLWLCTAVVHNTPQNSSDNLSSYHRLTAQVLSTGEIGRAWWTGTGVASARPACDGKVAGLTSVRDSSRTDPGQVIYYQAVSFDTGHTEQWCPAAGEGDRQSGHASEPHGSPHYRALGPAPPRQTRHVSTIHLITASNNYTSSIIIQY